MKSTIVVEEIYQTFTTTKPNKFKCTLVATGSRELISAYVERLTEVPFNKKLNHKQAKNCHECKHYEFIKICSGCVDQDEYTA